MRKASLYSLWLTSIAMLVACDDGSVPYEAGGGSGNVGAGGAGVPAGGGSESGGGVAPIVTSPVGSGGTSSSTTPPSTTKPTDIACSVSPVNPNATQQAKNLLCYLYSIKGKSVLSGQQETSWNWQATGVNSPSVDVDWIKTQTGQYPAVLGGDFLYPGVEGKNAPGNGTTTRAIAWWNDGGIPLIRYHMGAPPLTDTYDNSKLSADLTKVITSGTTENTSFKIKLDYAATQLKLLQDANVAILWAPFHEIQANGWFWWAKGTGAQFIALWKYTYDYLTTTKGLNHLIWLLPYSGTPSSDYYPGDDVVDLTGPDTYATGMQPFSSLYQTTASIARDGSPIPLHETGEIVDPDKMFPSVAPWVLFNVWCGYENGVAADAAGINTVAEIKTAYSSQYTITRDEVPSLK